jgi:hypothetical protein
MLSEGSRAHARQDPWYDSRASTTQIVEQIPVTARTRKINLIGRPSIRIHSTVSLVVNVVSHTEELNGQTRIPMNVLPSNG